MNKISDTGYLIGRPFVRAYLFLFTNPKIYHKENIPKKGGCIIASNHLSNYDGSLVGCTTTRAIHFLAKKELFDNKILGPIVRFIGLISVDRKNKSPEAKQMALDALSQDKIVGIFPEGTRNKTNDYILPFKYGAVSFAYKSGKPIVPMAIVNKPKFLGYKTKIIIGKPYYVKSDDLEKENKKLEDTIIKLIKEGKLYEK